jgi:CRP-like cAMP-binding protein
LQELHKADKEMEESGGPLKTLLSLQAIEGDETQVYIISKAALMDILRKPRKTLEDGKYIYENLMREGVLCKLFEDVLPTDTPMKQRYQICRALKYEAAEEGDLILKQNSKMDLKLYIIMTGQVRVYRDNNCNVDTLTKEDILELKTLDEAVLKMLKCHEDEMHLVPDINERILQAKASMSSRASMMRKRSGSDSMELNSPLRKRARRGTKLVSDVVRAKDIENIRNNIGAWGDASALRWSQKDFDDFTRRMREFLRENDIKNYSAQQTKYFLGCRIEFLKLFYSDPIKRGKMLEAILRKYLGVYARVMQENEMFGEKALESSAPRSASIVADRFSE